MVDELQQRSRAGAAIRCARAQLECTCAWHDQPRMHCSTSCNTNENRLREMLHIFMMKLNNRSADAAAVGAISFELLVRHGYRCDRVFVACGGGLSLRDSGKLCRAIALACLLVGLVDSIAHSLKIDANGADGAVGA